MATCRVCEGTKVFLANNSWFTADGYHRVRCWFCNGQRIANDAASPETVKQQRYARDRVRVWGGLRPKDAA